MRTVPIKTKPTSRRVLVWLLMWGLNWRMKRLQNDIDVWSPVSATPSTGSPWEATQAFAASLKDAGQIDPILTAKTEPTLQIDAVEDQFFMLRAAQRAPAGPPPSGISVVSQPSA